MKNYLLSLLFATLFFACAKDNGKSTPSTDGETAYLALNFQNKNTSSTTKAPTDVAGTALEDKITTAVVLLFDENDVCLGSIDIKDADLTTLPTTGTKAKEVSAKTKKIFVVINNYNAGWDLGSATVLNKSWEAINASVPVTIPNIARDNNFVMGNYNGLTAVTLYDTAATAEGAPSIVPMNRLSSKVTVDGTVAAANVPNATFTFENWDLNTVNKTTQLFTEFANIAGESGKYRIDNNYYKKDLPVNDPERVTYLTTNFAWLSNDVSGAPSVLTKASNGVAYCTENTMDATAQIWGLTTKAVIKGKYTPNNDEKGTALTAGDSYFMYSGKFYSVANMKAEFRLNNGLKTDIVAFLEKTGVLPTDLDTDDKIDTAIDGLGAYSGIKARYLAVKYFYQSVCYYDALIRHDDAITTPMALGRYGVVRNNAYKLTINSVKGPGTPWIPDPTDPKDPTDPTDPDDEAKINLSIKVTINPWTSWSHAVDLG